VQRLNANGSDDLTWAPNGRTVQNLAADDYGIAVTPGRNGDMFVSTQSNWLNNTIKLTTPQIGQFATDWTTGASEFGACLETTSAGASGGAGVSGWTVAGDNQCLTTLPANWNAIPATSALPAAKVAAATVANTTGATVTMRFAVRTALNQAPGLYLAPLVFEVIAPNA
jgi:hypothetical protein